MRPFTFLAGWPRSAQAAVLLVLSALFVAVLEAGRLPAALLLGPLLAGILVEEFGASLRVPVLGSTVAQAVVGCLIARTITPTSLHTVAERWPLFVGFTFGTLLLSCVLGWWVARLRVVPGTTAVWGLMPGGASAMVLMSGAFGADARLVAFMQYLRVLFVTVLASLVARWWIDTPVSPVVAANPFALPGPSFAPTALLLVAVVALGRVSRVPNGAMLVAMVAGAWLQDIGWLTIELPPALLAVSYALLGWSIGLRFTREVMTSAGRAFWPTVGSIVVLIVCCVGLAAALGRLLGIDALAAYLATSPGGADSVAIIAASSHVDAPLVMAFQTARLLAVVAFGPMLSRFIARRVGVG